MAFALKSNWGSFHNPDFNRLQTEIEQQTQALLKQREIISTISNKPANNQPYLRPIESKIQTKLNSDRSNNQTINSRSLISEKVRELVDLCKRENSAFGNQLMKVLTDEKNISNDLVNSGGRFSHRTQYFGVGNPILEANKESSVDNGSREKQTSLSSSNQSPSKMNVPAKSNLREAMETNPKLQVSDDIIQMIEQIERKALNQIERLREQKIELMKQLKQQIQSNNELQREINNLSQERTQMQNLSYLNENPQQEDILRQIRNQMEYLRRENQNLRSFANKTHSQEYNAQYSLNPNELQNLRQRISVLEAQLRNRDEFIKALDSQVNRLNQQGGNTNNYHLLSLIQQGESIRQQTLQLIRLKEGYPSSQQIPIGRGGFNEQERIRELEELLHREEEQKQNFLNDLLIFKQKYQQLEEENRALKAQGRIGSSDIARFSPIVDRSYTGNIVANSTDDYERYLSQMRATNRY